MRPPFAAGLRGLCMIAVASLVLLINAGVLMALFGVGSLIRFDGEVFLLGKALSLATITDLQWQVFALVLLVALGPLVLLNWHVRVDFLAETFSSRTRRITEILGHILFGLPFAILFLPPAWSFFQRSWRIDEGGVSGGLQDIYVIKFVLFAGFALLALCLALRLLADVVALLKGQ